MSEALRLADAVERVAKWSDSEHWDTLEEAAAELRRLHALNAELVEALKSIADLYDTDDGCKTLPQYVAARAALSKVEASNG